MHPSLMPRKKGALPSGFAREQERGRLLPAGRLPRGGLRGPSDIWRTFTFASEGLRRLDLAAREWAGLVG